LVKVVAPFNFKENKMTNTKQRHNEIQSVAANLIALAGGIEAIDALPQDQHKAAFNRLVDALITQTGCASRQIARQNVAKAMRKGRDYLGGMATRGGTRVPGPGKTLGPAPLPPGQKRQQVSTRLAPGYVEKAKAIAEAKGLAGWGRAVEMALDLMIERDPELV
jgi:hypothetical protein